MLRKGSCDCRSHYIGDSCAQNIDILDFFNALVRADNWSLFYQCTINVMFIMTLEFLLSNNGFVHLSEAFRYLIFFLLFLISQNGLISRQISNHCLEVSKLCQYGCDNSEQSKVWLRTSAHLQFLTSFINTLFITWNKQLQPGWR